MCGCERPRGRRAFFCMEEKLDLLSPAAKLFSQSKFAESRSVVHMRKRCLNNVHKGVTDDKAFWAETKHLAVHRSKN